MDDWVNALSTVLFSRRKDTPAKNWWSLDPWHPAVGRALKIDRTQEGGVFALAPFRLWHDGEKHVILAAHPAPRILGPIDSDWLAIANVIAWDPKTDRAIIVGDAGDSLVGAFSDNVEGTLFRSPREFFTSWAIARAQFFAQWVATRKGNWAHPAPERDLIPGKLAIGDLGKIAWVGLPSTVQARGINPQTLNRAILRQANLPRAVASQERYAA